jgi:hypothetical protein
VTVGSTGGTSAGTMPATVPLGGGPD